MISFKNVTPADVDFNARTLVHVPEAKRKRIALETLEIYAPIADRLGMSVAKQELEDAAFPHAYPDEYKKTMAIVQQQRQENVERLEKLERNLKKELMHSLRVKLNSHCRLS